MFHKALIYNVQHKAVPKFSYNVISFLLQIFNQKQKANFNWECSRG